MPLKPHLSCFSHIHTLDDITSRLQELELEGVIYDDELSREELIERIRHAVDNPLVKDWFSPRWLLHNECPILEKDPTTRQLREHRPDRVMSDGKTTLVVDFKFGMPRAEYEQQVKRYISLLRNMGADHVRGYLWYVLRNEVVEVE